MPRSFTGKAHGTTIVLNMPGVMGLIRLILSNRTLRVYYTWENFGVDKRSISVSFYQPIAHFFIEPV